jgi:hypothetical protein
VRGEGLAATQALDLATFAATSRCSELKENPLTQAARFRKLLRRDGMIIAPGAYDCIAAPMIARAGSTAST